VSFIIDVKNLPNIIILEESILTNEKKGSPHCEFCTLGCGLFCLDFNPSPFSSLVPYAGCFFFFPFNQLIIYLFTKKEEVKMEKEKR